MKYLIVYHANCIDGITSATVITKHILENLKGETEDITLYPASYDDDLDVLLDQLRDNITDKIFIVDLSFTKTDLLTINKYVPTIDLYDHHASAFRNLLGKDYPITPTSKEAFWLTSDEGNKTDIYIVLDNNECGASLCWKSLMQNHLPEDARNTNIPALIHFVKDYDLWRFKDPHTRAINKYLKQLAKNVEVYTLLLLSFQKEKVVEAAYREGQLLLTHEDKIENEIISQGVGSITINGIVGLVVNAPYAFASNLGNKLAEKSHSFGAVWCQYSGGRVGFSLRSIGDECDVSKLAEVMGGGGHKNASGFSIASPGFDPEKGITLWSAPEDLNDAIQSTEESRAKESNE